MIFTISSTPFSTTLTFNTEDEAADCYLLLMDTFPSLPVGYEIIDCEFKKLILMKDRKPFEPNANWIYTTH